MQTIATTNVIQGVILFKGEDSAKFLQGQLTCDLEQLSKTRTLYGAYCTPNGRVRTNFILVMKSEDEILMILHESQIEYILSALAPYIAFFKATVENVSANYTCFGLKESSDGEEIKESLVFNSQILPDKYWQSVHDVEIITVRLPIMTPTWLGITSKSLPKMSEISATQWQVAELNAGLVWINETNREEFLPHDLSLPLLGAVSFEKGCYTGQEIVARMHYRGKPKYELAIIQTEPVVGEIYDESIQIEENSKIIKAGKIVHKVKLNDKSYIICASVKSMLLKAQQFQLLSEERSILCSIKLPESIKESNDL